MVVKVNISNSTTFDIRSTMKYAIDELKDPDNHVLSIQLDYRDHNTIFYLNKVDEINFEKDYMEIRQGNDTRAFFKYDNILEYCLINAEEVIDLGAAA